MKEASFGVQHDLILRKEIGILTDGHYSKKKDGFQQCKFYYKFILIYNIFKA